MPSRPVTTSSEQSLPASQRSGSRPPRILSLGDLLLDLVVRYDPVSGEADTGPDAVQLWPGGSAANFAVWASRLGASVRFVSRVGSDWSGDMLIHSLRDSGVTAEVAVAADVATGRVLVMVDAEGTRRMWSYPGASASIQPEDLQPDWFSGLDAFHLTGYSLLREGPRAAALEALRFAREHGALCTLDPNPPHLISGYGPSAFRELLMQLQLDIIFPNFEEGRLLAGLHEAGPVALELLSLSPLVVLKLGDRGCLIASRGSSEPLYVEPARVELVRDDTGAGDAFAAGFMVEYLVTRDLRAAAMAANRLAARVVGQVGAR